MHNCNRVSLSRLFRSSTQPMHMRSQIEGHLTERLREVQFCNAAFKIVDSRDESSALCCALAVGDSILKKSQFAVKMIDTTLHLPTIDSRQHGPKRIED